MRIRSFCKFVFLYCLIAFIINILLKSASILVFSDTKHTILDVYQNPMAFKQKTPPPRKIIDIDCRRLIEYDKVEMDKAKTFMTLNLPKRLTVEEFINKTKDCVQFRQEMHYDIFPITDEERDFPIAFSILTFKDVNQTERLLRAIYRPHNFYCIHVDHSSSQAIHNAMRGICDCLENVFIVSKTEDVIYNHVSRLQADLNCMTDLLKISKRWRYFINLPHQQFPLKTNLEMVKILKIYNGANDIEGITSPRRMLKDRFKYIYKYLNYTKAIKLVGVRKTNPPHNVNIVKGSAYGVFSREFVHFVIKDKKSRDILNYMMDMKSPDEYFWATLNHNKVLRAPGQYTGNA